MSNTQTRRTFTKEFKVDVVDQSEHCEKITELAADLGLRPARSGVFPAMESKNKPRRKKDSSASP